MKKLVIYGDSLSTGTHGEGGYLEALRHTFAPEQLVNLAVGSSGCAAGTPNGMVHLLEQDIPASHGADLTLIWHGTNDWYWGTPLGSPANGNTKTFYGAIAHAVNLVRRHSPEGMLVWATPIWRYEAPAGSAVPGPADFTVNAAGLTLPDYTAALRAAADAWHFPLIETGRLCGICAQNEAMLLEDHVHPNAAGYRKIAPVLCGELKRIWNYRGAQEMPESAPAAPFG